MIVLMLKNCKAILIMIALIHLTQSVHSMESKTQSCTVSSSAHLDDSPHELCQKIWNKLGKWLKVTGMGYSRLRNLKEYDDLYHQNEPIFRDRIKTFSQDFPLDKEDSYNLVYLEIVLKQGMEGRNEAIWKGIKWDCFSDRDKKYATKIMELISTYQTTQKKNKRASSFALDHLRDVLEDMNTCLSKLLIPSFLTNTENDDVEEFEDQKDKLFRLYRLTKDFKSLNVLCSLFSRRNHVTNLSEEEIEALLTLRFALSIPENPLLDESTISGWRSYTKEEKEIMQQILDQIDHVLEEMKDQEKLCYSNFSQTILNRQEISTFRSQIEKQVLTLSEKEILENKIKENIDLLSSILKTLVGENKKSHEGNPDIVWFSHLSMNPHIRNQVHQIFEFTKESSFSIQQIQHMLSFLPDLENSMMSFNLNQAKAGWIQTINSTFTRLSPEETLETVQNSLNLSSNIKTSLLQLLEMMTPGIIDEILKDADDIDSIYQQRLISYAQKSEIWILSLDGGGIRGIIAATLLHELEKILKKPICQLFELLAGTSTGGIIALGLGVPTYPGSTQALYTAKDVLELYTTRGDHIFPKISKHSKMFSQVFSSAYNPTTIEKLFNDYYQDHFLSSAVTPVMVTVTDFTERKKTILSTFRSIHHPEEDILIRNAARGTSAAPTYFPPLTVKHNGKIKEYLDGGLVGNNPILDAFYESRKIYPEATKINILSIGTGTTKTGKYQYGQRAFGGLISGNEGASVLVDVFSLVRHEFSRSGEEMLCEHLIPEYKEKGIEINYFRINPQLDEKIHLDKVSDEIVQKLVHVGQSIITTPDFEKVIESLKTRT